LAQEDVHPPFKPKMKMKRGMKSWELMEEKVGYEDETLKFL